MLFALFLTDDGTVVLDDVARGEPLAVIEAANWREARQAVWNDPALDPYDYMPGNGWRKRQEPDSDA